MKERYDLSVARIAECTIEGLSDKAFDLYFKRVGAFLLLVKEQLEAIEDGSFRDYSIEELQEKNRALFFDVLPENYETSYANPTYAVAKLSEKYGQLFSYLVCEFRKCIGYAYEQKIEEFVARLELYLELYNSFEYELEETGKIPDYDTLQGIVYWFVSDYSDIETLDRISGQVNPNNTFAKDIIMDSDLTDLRYLYYYGCYVSENELRIAQFLLTQPEEKIELMAHTYIEGYRKGFEAAKKDLSKKNTAGLYYHIGFERVMKKAVEKLSLLKLEPTTNRDWFSGAIANRQYGFDHRDDLGLFLDKDLVHRKLDVLKTAFEQFKDEANTYAGPAVVEVFGETPFAPVSKTECVEMSKEQQKLYVELRSQSGQITNQYIKGEERSFTIIAFPLPEIGEPFEEIFNEVIRINTLDYELYQGVQQTIIDALDTAEYVHIKGEGANQTNLCVALHKLEDIATQTNFENCVADVNIPVGEVFTSPVLKGTTGILHVSKVFLHELEYQDLKIVFTDGMISEYTCSNFADVKKGQKYIKDHVMFKHDTLPMGEFAIGTNTTAYVVAKKYDIGHKLPILIAEKMGPHFAVGDTCYSHQEEVAMYNPDGKEIIARDNEVSLLRDTDMSKAYFNCHTDITIPYDELDSIEAVAADGTRLPIISKGKFVLPGTEILNVPFEDMK
ncbi:MAG: aminopeptidase [Lachnospiraceae bacterium]